MRSTWFMMFALAVLATSCGTKARSEYTFKFRSDDGLGDRAIIKFLGVEVGYIRNLHLAPDGESVVATGYITEPNMRILQGDTGQVVLTGLLGDPEIEIVRSSTNGTELPAGSTIVVSTLSKEAKDFKHHANGLVRVLTATTNKNAK